MKLLQAVENKKVKESKKIMNLLQFIFEKLTDLENTAEPEEMDGHLKFSLASLYSALETHFQKGKTDFELTEQILTFCLKILDWIVINEKEILHQD